jgi:hypothetical protein
MKKGTVTRRVGIFLTQNTKKFFFSFSPQFCWQSPMLIFSPKILVGSAGFDMDSYTRELATSDPEKSEGC